jgi:site-specific recombinase XerD
MERWLDRQRIDKTEQTISTYYYRLKLFVEWCEREEIESIGALDGWTLGEYTTHRRSKEPETTTVKNETVTLRSFLSWCERRELVDEGLADKISIPQVPAEEQSSNVKLEDEDALALLSYYREPSNGMYGTRTHTLLELLWHTGARIGGIVALDLEDLRTHEDGDHYLLFHNRPATDTRLKKGPSGERPVLISDRVWDVVQTYIDENRHDVTDEYGREPLLTSRNGRPAKSTVRGWCYQATVPCWHSDCPHGKERDTCEWTGYTYASKCPSSRSPHQIRTGAITWMRNQGLSADVVAQRCNAKVSTIEQHYDKADPVEEMLHRRLQAADLDIENTEDNP